jgi:hypothetical protein
MMLHRNPVLKIVLSVQPIMHGQPGAVKQIMVRERTASRIGF